MEQRTTLVLEDTEKHAQAVKRFRSLCDMHRIPFGGVTNLSDLACSLKDNRHFAMDFWAMVGDMSAQERGSLRDPEMLEVIVEGSTGAAVTALPETEKAALGDLRNLLAGVDLEAPVLPDPIAAPVEDTSIPEALLSASHRESSPLQSNGSSPSRRKGDTTEISSARESISDALLRLEQMSRELRDQMVAIDQIKRSKVSSQTQVEEKAVETAPIEKIEEPVGNRIQEVSIPVVVTADEDQSSFHEAEAQATSATLAEMPAPQTQNVDQRIASDRVLPVRPVKEQEVFAPRSASSLSRRGLAPPADVDDDPSIVVPLAAYAEENRKTITFRILAVVLFVGVIAAVWFMVNRGYAHSLTSRSGAFISDKLTLFRQEIHNLTADTPTPAPTKQPEPTATHQAPPPMSQPQTQVAPQPTPSQAPQPQPATKSAPQLPVNTHANAPTPAVREQPAPLDESNAIRVPSSVMEENLLVSRVPIYPEGARAMRLEGTVVVETVISESGAVRYARAVSGDPRLRAAAEEAVMKWRYKPYTLNGRAVEVATQMRVSFRLR